MFLRRASILLVCLCAACARSPKSAPIVKGGVGRVVITPKQNMWMSGYASRTAPSDGKIHELWAKALAIEDETGAKSVVVTTDLIGLPADISARTAEIALKKFGVPRERLMLTSSHTHCGPVIRNNLSPMYELDEKQAELVNQYADALPGLIAEAIGQAIDDLEPCRLAYNCGFAGFAANRRQYNLQGVGGGVNPIGPVDRGVPTLRVARKNKSVKAVLFSYACHNTTLDFQKFCGDYAGFAQACIEQKSPGTTALFMMGCGADINPDPRRTLELAEQYGNELGEVVLKIMKGEMVPVGGPIQAKFKEIPLALSDPPSPEQLQTRLQGPDVYQQRLAKLLLRTWAQKGKLDTTYPYPVQVWQFGDGRRLIALGGEVVVDYDLLLKHQLGAEKTWVVGYANDVMAYIPSLRILHEGGYEGGGAMVYYGLYGPWAPSVEQDILKAVKDLSPPNP